jgi:hypothetical protein
MKLRTRGVGVLAALLLTFASGPALAQVITFENRQIDFLNLAGPQTEGAFQYHATVGIGWEVQPDVGNPPSALATYYNGQGSATGDTVEIRRIDNGPFSFQSVDFRTINPENSDDVRLSGFRNGSLVGTLDLTTSSTTFQTVPSGFAGPIDLLRVVLSFGGQQNAMILDNFVVPEPSGVVLLGACGVGLLTRRNHRRRQVARS